MSNPADQLPPELPRITIAARAPADAQQAAGRDAAARVLMMWARLPGRFPWVTLLVIFASVVITVCAHAVREPTYRVFYTTGLQLWLEWKWWGLLGSAFIHGSALHLLFNCYWIWIFGRLLERELGRLRYMGLFLAGTWIGGAAEIAWSGEPGRERAAQFCLCDFPAGGH